ncbi:PD-(D/E)XK nuclease family protein [Candidatus Saccharibacteria bacterium]|nr:PD-(D/E)XK nuclease family protein [Candidatus Saccharibacteria bacterium]
MVAATWDYIPNQKAPCRLSRSRLQLFLDCPRCFWLVMRQRIKRPSMPDFLLNDAVDRLLKKEFDIYREKGEPHPLMKKNKLKAVPFQHADLDKWRNPFEGIQHLDKELNLLVFGGLDDVWINEDEELMVVDYKATAKDKPIKELYAPGTYHDSYRRQLEVYQWLLAQNGFKVSPTAYFVYATGDRTVDKFSNRIKFDTNLIVHEGKTDWIEQALKEAKACLDGGMPKYRRQPACEHCNYVLKRLGLADKLKPKKK